MRISVTDRCNFRCQYCMPAAGLPWLERAEELKHQVNEPGFVRPARTMSAIGG